MQGGGLGGLGVALGVGLEEGLGLPSRLGHRASGWLFGNEYKNETHWLETPERVLTCFWVGMLL